MSPMATRVLTARVPLQLAKNVDQWAGRRERSRGWIVQQALAAWLAQEEERLLTLEALADVDAGRVLEHQAVQLKRAVLAAVSGKRSMTRSGAGWPRGGSHSSERPSR